MSDSNQNLLTVRGLGMRFGGILALDSVNFTVRPGSVTALIGPNGAGKTTVFNCITGFYRASQGNIWLHSLTDSKDLDLIRILGVPFCISDLTQPTRLLDKLYYKMFGGSHLVARAGVARTFQNIRLFQEMTSVENLLVAQHQGLNRNLVAGMLNTPAYHQAEKSAVNKAYYWLERCGLEEDANRLAGQLPYGHQRRLEIARAMCTNPCLICLDEPAAGLNPRETTDLGKMIRSLRNELTLTVLLIEHDMNLVMDISNHIVVLDHGVVIAAGTPQKIRNDPKVLAAYLGEETEEVVA